MTNELSNIPGGGVSTWLSPNSFESAMKIAELMAKCGTLPAHLQGKPSDCFRIVIQAAKWHMDPFVVGECTSLVHGRMCFEGKLVSAALKSMNAIEKKLSYAHSGEGQGMSIVVTGTPKGESSPVSVRGSVKEWRTVTYKKDGSGQVPNGWDKDPFSMLIYRGTRQWARLYVPEVIMGIYTPDEIEEIKEVEGVVVPDPVAPRRQRITKDKEHSPTTDVTPPGGVATEETKTSTIVKDIAARRSEMNIFAGEVVKKYGTTASTAIKVIRARYDVDGKGIPDDKIQEAFKDIQRLDADLAEDAGKA